MIRLKLGLILFLPLPEICHKLSYSFCPWVTAPAQYFRNAWMLCAWCYFHSEGVVWVLQLFSYDGEIFVRFPGLDDNPVYICRWGDSTLLLYLNLCHVFEIYSPRCWLQILVRKFQLPPFHIYLLCDSSCSFFLFLIAWPIRSPAFSLC